MKFGAGYSPTSTRRINARNPIHSDEATSTKRSARRTFPGGCRSWVPDSSKKEFYGKLSVGPFSFEWTLGGLRKSLILISRGKGFERSFIRSGGTTRLASRQEIGTLMLHSRTPRWEDLHSSLLLTDDELVSILKVEPVLKMLDRPMPAVREELLAWMESERFIHRDASGGGFVTNLGAVAAAGRLADFPDLSRKAVRVIVYDGLNKAHTKQEQEGSKGYAISFQGLMNFVIALLPQSEVIESALRVRRKFKRPWILD